MRWCPRCNQLVEIIKHTYFHKFETETEIVCCKCGKVIEVLHFPKKRRWRREHQNWVGRKIRG